MSWLAITETIVKGSAGLAGPELTAARTAALGSGVTDTLSDVIDRITTEVRGYVGRRNVLGDEGTIPNECLTAALSRIVFELCLRIPRGVILTEQRDKANSNAIRYLESVAAGDVAIVPPESAAPAQAAGHGAQLVSSTTRTATKKTMAGL